MRDARKQLSLNWNAGLVSWSCLGLRDPHTSRKAKTTAPACHVESMQGTHLIKLAGSHFQMCGAHQSAEETAVRVSARPNF